VIPPSVLLGDVYNDVIDVKPLAVVVDADVPVLGAGVTVTVVDIGTLDDAVVVIVVVLPLVLGFPTFKGEYTVVLSLLHLRLSNPFDSHTHTGHCTSTGLISSVGQPLYHCEASIPGHI
jgi:hypothetical protein